METSNERLEFHGGMFMSLVPVAIYVFFCVVLFIIFKAFNMEALAVGGFLALLFGGLLCKSYSKFWDSAINGICSITSVSVVVILLLVGMFSQLIKICGLSNGFVWLANSIGIRGGMFVAFTFIAVCIVSTATGSSIGTMFIAFPSILLVCCWGHPLPGWLAASFQALSLATIWRRSPIRPLLPHPRSNSRMAALPILVALSAAV